MPLYGRRHSKPNPGTLIDWGHPLAQGLVGLWPFNEGSGVPTNVASQLSASSNTMAWASSSRGPVLSNTGTSRYVQQAIPGGSPLSVTGKAITYGAWAYPLATNIFHCLLAAASVAGNVGRQYSVFLSSSGTGNVFVALGDGAVAGGNIAVSPGWVANSWNLVLVTYDGANVRVWINGVQAGTLAATASIPANSGLSVYMGYDPPNSANALNGSLDMPAVWNRALSAAEIMAWYANPYQVFAPPGYRIFGLPSRAWLFGDQIEANGLG